MAKEKDIFNQIEKEVQEISGELSERRKNWNDFEDAYLGYIDKKKNPYSAQVFMPESFEKVERTVSHVFANSPRGRFMPREVLDTKGILIADEVFKYQWNEPRQQMSKKMKRMGRTTGIFGTAWGGLFWKYTKEKREKVTKEGVESKHVTTWDGPLFKDYSIYDVFPDTAGIDIEDHQFVTVCDYSTLEELEAEQRAAPKWGKPYKNLGKLREKVEADRAKGGSDEEATVTENSDGAEDIRGSSTGVKKGRIKLYRKYMRNRWQTIAVDYGLVIEDRPNPYDHGDLCIHKMTFIDYMNQSFGIGDIEPILRLQKALNALVNQRLDNVEMSLNKMFKVRHGYKYNHTLKSRPGQKVLVDDMDDVQEFPIQDFSGGSFAQSFSALQDSISKTVGQFDVLNKSQFSGDRTATEVRGITGEQNARMRAKETSVDTFIARLGTQWMQLNQQFINKDKVVRIVGREAVMELERRMAEDGVEQEVFVNGEEQSKLQVAPDYSYALFNVSPEDIRGAFDFVVETGTMTGISQEQETQDLLSAIKLLVDSQAVLKEVAQTQINIKPILEKVLINLGVKNVDMVLEPLAQQMAEPGTEAGGGAGDVAGLVQAALGAAGGEAPAAGSPTGGQLPNNPNVATMQATTQGIPNQVIPGQ